MPILHSLTFKANDILGKHAGSQCLTSGYWQVEVAGEHQEKTAFYTQGGLFEFNVMPFGSATFQRWMNSIVTPAPPISS